MRVIVQRVMKAQVEVVGKYTEKIERGIVILCAFSKDDTAEKIAWAAQRIAKLRIFKDTKDKLNRSVLDKKGSALVVSNFTLYGDCLHGTRPDFSKALVYNEALLLYNDFIKELKRFLPVKSGEFGGDMVLSVVADGPSTVIMDN